jgi:FK506-binding nuclear protein
LTGNFVIRPEELDSDDEEEDEEEDLIDGEGGLYGLEGMIDSDESGSEVDELDDLDEPPRITELGEDDEEVPKLIKVTKTKRVAAELDSDEVDDALDKILGVKSSEKVDKKAKHQAKKLKTNEGQAVAGSEPTNGETKKESKSKTEKAEKKSEASKPAETKKSKADKKEAPVNGTKKVQFAEKLEQGPTPSANGLRVIKGVTIDERKPGSGAAAKKNDKVALRYIGKLDDGKMFDGKLIVV